MKYLASFFVLTMAISISSSTYSQELIQLPITVETDAQWPTAEREFLSKDWDTEVITNVSKPSMEIFRPENSNGTAVIICPGGGLYGHSINSEGRDVAKWLVAKGVTAFVLKYRLVPTGEDGSAEAMVDPNVETKARKMLPAAVSDGLNAIKHVRDNSHEYGVEKDRIGIIGFSAGGAVTMGTTYAYTKENKPNFIGPIYAWFNVIEHQDVPADAPPLFALCATDDPLDLAAGSVKLYQQWIEAGVSAELHMYSKGGHGFGMKTQNLPTDSWIERFGDWLAVLGLIER